jgi:Flp pilus assembly protein TadB
VSAAVVLILAHAGHWIVSALYLAPVVVIVGALMIQSHRERRRARRSDEEDASQP